MDKSENFRMVGGEITAFLSMILLLLLALVGTTLESARVNVGKSYADRSIQSGVDSLFTEYCIPLWEDYHVFFLEGEESKEQDENYIRNSLYDYMKPVFSKEEKKGSMDLLDMNIQQMEIIDITRAEDYDRELLLHEILEYSKYRADEAFLSDGEKIMKKLEEAEACMTVIEKQIEAEEKMAEVNLEILEFISSVEGISVGKTGILKNKTGLLKTEDYFVKKFCPMAVTKENLGINHDIVWQSLQKSYCNPLLLLERLEQEAESIQMLLELAKAQAEAGEEVIIVNYGGFYRARTKLFREVNGVLKEIKNAKKQLEKIKAEQFVFQKEAEELERVFKAQEAKLSEENKMAFLGEVEGLKGFAGLENNEDTSMIAAVLAMENHLEENQKLLEEIQVSLGVSLGNSPESVENYIDLLQHIKTRWSDYHLQELKFDYSSLVVEKEVENPVEAFSKVYKNNLLELVIKEPNSISQNTKKTQKRQVENKTGLTLEFLISEPLQQFLLSDYIEEHFKCFGKVQEKVQKEEKEKKMETVLEYEQEYLLSGKCSDRENLEEAVNKLVLAKSMTNYMYLLTDKEKCDMAYGTAVALVGYSGMEPLVRLTKNMILLVWAAQEAMVDVSGLLQGKELPVFKTKETFLIAYEELLQFNRALIQSKSEKMPVIAGEMVLNYEECLQLLLMMSSKEKKLAGVAELIEDNIRLRYDEDFVLSNCIYGITVEGTFWMNEKFVSLPFVQQMLSTSGKGYLINSQQSYCY